MIHFTQYASLRRLASAFTLVLPVLTASCSKTQQVSASD